MNLLRAVKVIELIPTDGNTVVIQAEMSGPIPAEVPGVAKKGQDVHIPESTATFCVSTRIPRSLGSMSTGTTPSSTISRRAACDGAT